jgi:serine phosphatase RsbU (regulator of sigma subunit)
VTETAALAESESRSLRMQHLTEALVRAVSPSDVAAATLTHGTAVMEAQWAHLVLLGDDHDVSVSLLGGHGIPYRKIEPVLFDSSPWSDAIRRLAPITFRSSDDLVGRYPALAKEFGPLGTGALTTPLVLAGRAVGAITFGLGQRRWQSRAARTTAERVASLCAHAAERALLYDSEHRVSETLQRALFPGQLPYFLGLDLCSRYLPAAGVFDVGGDWYDAIALAGGRVGLAVGDVAGHGIPAATLMASLRSALRAFASVEPSPASVLSRMNAFTCTFAPDDLATLLFLVIDPEAGTVRFARAGHPPALLVGDHGAEFLGEALGLPLGTMTPASYPEWESAFAPGALLVAYTDGLYERRDEAVDEGLARLAGAAAGAPTDSAEDFCEALVGEMLTKGEPADDAALLAARRGGAPD